MSISISCDKSELTIGETATISISELYKTSDLEFYEDNILCNVGDKFNYDIGYKIDEFYYTPDVVGVHNVSIKNIGEYSLLSDSFSNSITFNVKSLETSTNTNNNVPLGNDDVSTNTNNNVPLGNDDVKFQTRILLDKTDTVYGAEIILFDENYNSLDRILITNETNFNTIHNSINALKHTYLPYTKKDKDSFFDLLEYYNNGGNENSSIYENLIANLSDLQKFGDLQSILYNNGNFDEQTKSNYNIETGDITRTDNNKQTVLINATHLSGLASDSFSKVNHTHNEYVEKTEINNVLTPNDIVDDLTSSNKNKSLSANQGNLLKKEIDNLKGKYKWSNVITAGKGNYIKYRVNPDLRLVSCNYNRNDYTGCKKDTGNQSLHPAGTIDSSYAPNTRVTSPLYRGDFVLSFESDGSVNLYNLTKKDKINIHVKVMWHY